ncbi:MAG: TonB-dependent receptor [Bacteroidota bacterium]|nr:TonB-dependent receptor [Bacteroidota bacterium]
MKQSPIFKKALFLFMALSFFGMSWAQTKSISGTVKNATGEPVVGATVTVKGTTIGTVTDANGVFNLNAPAQAKTLEFTSIGFQKEEVEIKGAVIDVVLRESSKMLDEVIVIGYGTVKKSDLTGSVSSMNSGDVVQKGTLNVVSAIQGSVAGVQIQQSSSRAGASYNITVRGQNSVSGTTTPLYVVDGVITSNIDFLNPQDIEKIDVLKDASSTAIYGSRGSHGVVIVQTRSGKSVQGISKPVISYNGYYGISKITRMPDFMDTREWMKYRMLNYQYTSDANNDGVIEIATSDLKNVWMGGVQLRDLNDGKGLQPVYADGTFGGSKWLLDRYLANTSTDWVGLVTQKGVQENHYIDISGSTRDIAYVVGVGYQNEKGVFVNDSYQRYNLKGSVNANLSDKWSTGFNISTGYSTQETGSDNAMLSAFRMSPIVAAYTNGNLDPALNHLIGDVIVVPGKTTETLKDANGNAIFPNSIGSGGFTSSINPLIDLASTSNNTKKIVALGSAYLQFIPFKNLILKTTISPSITSYRTGLYKSTLAEGNYDNPLTTAVENDAKANVENFTYYNYTWDNQVNYKFTLNNDHNFDLMGLFSLYSENSEDYNTNTAGYNYNYEWYNLGTATNTANTKLTSYYSEASMVSYAARANYSYKGKYLATASIREDGSSKLAEGHKWASFPSASVAWRVSEESFMESFKNILSNLKFRLSLGYTGNNNINPFLTQLLANKSTYYNFGSTDALGVGIGSLVSQELTWEKTREFNLGIDMGFLNNRIDMTVDLYNRLSTGLLQNRTLPLESGGGTMTDNLGSVLNKGIELTLNANIIDNSNLKWNIGAAFTANRNKIKNLFGITTPGYIYINSNTQKWMVGENINSIYGYVYDGVWTADDILAAIASKDPRVINKSGVVIAREGQARIKDFDGNGIDASDRRIQGHSDPDWTAGLTTMLTFKGFDFSMNVYMAQGMTVFSPFMEEFTNYNDRGRQKLKMDYYIPKGAYILGDDGYFSVQQTAHNYQGRPMVYTDNGSKANCGPYWHNGKETANEMPGCWVDASYLKVRNIMLGYTLPKSFMNILKLNTIRLYCNVLNPFVSTNYEGFDPEWAGATMGKDNGPATVTYQFGVNVKF